MRENADRHVHYVLLILKYWYILESKCGCRSLMFLFFNCFVDILIKLCLLC